MLFECLFLEHSKDALRMLDLNQSSQKSSDSFLSNFPIRDPLNLQSGHVKAEGFVKAQLPLSALAAL